MGMMSDTESESHPPMYVSSAPGSSPGPGPGPAISDAHRVDLLVIGAGISGLCAATRALEATSANVRPVRVAVLEASSRVGGRTLTETIGGVRYDKGGTWIGPTQEHVHTLTKQLGIETMPQYHLGKKIADVRGRVRTYNSSIPLFVSPLALIDVVRAGLTLERARDAIDLDDPCKHPNAQYWDSLSVHAWMELYVTQQSSKDLIAIAIRGVWGCEPMELSFLQFLYYMKCAGGIETLINIKKGHQELVCLGGTQQISEKLAAQLGTEHYETGQLYLNHRVREIIQYRDQVHVICHNGTRWSASYVIAAIPPVIAASILYSPPLPVAREQLNQRSFMGSIIKAVIVYDTPFWRDHGYSGEVICDSYDMETSPVFNVYDFSRPHPTNQGTWTWALVTFMNGEAARVWSHRSYETRKRVVLQQIENWFGNKTGIALTPLDYGEKDWVNDEFTRGCPVSNVATGALWAAGHVLREPVGRLHWAGTETATQHQGFMDGAISAGYRAADEVLANLAAGTVTQPKPHKLATRAVVQRVPSRACGGLFRHWFVLLFACVIAYVWLQCLTQPERDHITQEGWKRTRHMLPDWVNQRLHIKQ